MQLSKSFQNENQRKILKCSLEAPCKSISNVSSQCLSGVVCGVVCGEVVVWYVVLIPQPLRDVNSTGFGDDILDIDAKQFGIQTRPNITFVGCKIGEIDCKAHWKAILTPYGACYVMKITNNEERFQIYALVSDWLEGPSHEHQIESLRKGYMTSDPFNQANSVLGLVVAINKSDSSFGWHGLR